LLLAFGEAMGAAPALPFFQTGYKIYNIYYPVTIKPATDIRVGTSPNYPVDSAIRIEPVADA
jgi:hypothetical protein